MHEEKQMTGEGAILTGASSAKQVHPWDTIDWFQVEKHVKRLQMRIAKAVRENRYGRAKALQRLLTSSYYAKLMAVRRVTQNQGHKTPGVDGVIWRTPGQKMAAARSLVRRGYRTMPLRRIYIPKKNGKLRPLSIPVMRCRGQQALHLLGLEPISEVTADLNSYGFRPKRSCADAIEQCFNSLARKIRSKWILEGDIKSCFDKISHPWLMDNIPMDKVMLGKWLSAGYMEQKTLYPTNEGTPQGGIISPVLLVMTLRGLEAAVAKEVQRLDKVNVVVYADDFIITGATKEILESKVKRAVFNFLRERGLELSEEKTKITHIDHGFDFLGFNVRKHNGKCLIKPAKANVKAFLKRIRETIKSKPTVKTSDLIDILNPKIRGWAYYYRNAVAKKVFSKVDSEIFLYIWEWANRRHPNKGKRWVAGHYFRIEKNRRWIFTARVPDSKGGFV